MDLYSFCMKQADGEVLEEVNASNDQTLTVYDMNDELSEEEEDLD